MSSRCRLRRTRFVNAALTEQTRTARHTEGWAVNLSAATRRGRSSKGMLLGYARVSMIDQNLALQRHALAEAGCQKIFHRTIVGRGHGSTSVARGAGICAQWRYADRLCTARD